MSYQIEFTEHARRLLRSLSTEVQPRLLKKLDEQVSLAADPRATGMDLVTREPELWAYQIGDFRLECQIDDENEVLVVLNMRREILRKGRRY